MNGERRFVVSMLAPIFFVLISFYVYPALFNVYNSFTDLSLLGLRRGGSFIGLGNYAKLLTSEAFYRVLWNTAFWLTAVSVALRIVLGFGLALLLNSEAVRRYRLITASRLILLVPWATPPVVAVIVFRWLLDQRLGTVNRVLLWLGVIDTPIAFFGDVHWVWPSVILIIVWNTLPMVSLTFLAALQSLPEELVEAAKVDGATVPQRIRYIILPHLRPTIIVITLLSCFWTFNNFLYIWLTTAGGPGSYTNVIATDIYIKAFIEYQLGYSSAIGIFAAMLMAAFALVYLRVVARREFQEIL
jgi:multiple sugar transport system permease protein